MSMTTDHKTSHKGQFHKIEIYTLSESCINKISIDVWFVRIGQYLADIKSVKYKLFDRYLFLFYA